MSLVPLQSAHMYLLKDAWANFVVFQHLLPSFKLIRAEPSLCFSPDQISDPGIHYMFFPAGAPQTDLITLHKSTVMHIKHSPQVLDSVSGMWDLLRVIFPLIHYGGSFFFPPSFISAHMVPDETCHWPNVLTGSICELLSECSGWQCGLQDRGQWTEAVRFLRVFHVCAS